MAINVDISFKITEGKAISTNRTIDLKKKKKIIVGSNSFDQTIDYIFSFAIPSF